MHSTNTSAQLSAKSGRPVALHRTQRQEDRRAQRRASLHHRPAQGAGHRRPPGVALHPCDRHRAERHLRRRGQRPSRFVAPGAAYRPRRNPLGQSRTHPLTRTERPLQRPHPLPPAPSGRNALRARRGRLHPLRPTPTGHHTRTVRRMVRRRRAGGFGRNLRMTASPQLQNAAACRTPEKHRDNSDSNQTFSL